MPVTTYDSSGGVIWDSDSVDPGVCIGAHLVAAGASLTLTYPSLVGATVRALSLAGMGDAGATVDTALGYPRVIISSQTYARQVLIWTSTPPSITPGTGLQVINPNGALVLTPEAFGLYYLGLATLYSTTASSGSGNDVALGFYTYRFTSALSVVPVVAINSLYSLVSATRYLGSSVWEFDVYSVTGSTDSLTLPVLSPPTIYVFGRISSPSTSPEFSLWDSSGNLCFDMFKPGLLTAKAEPEFAASTTTSATVPSVTTAGILGESGGFQTTSAANGAGFIATTRAYLWRMSSGSLTRTLMQTQRQSVDSSITRDARRAVTPLFINLTGL